MATKKKSSDKENNLNNISPGALHEKHRERMYKRFEENGFAGWAKHEVLEFMLFNVYTRRNTNDIAHKMFIGSNNSFSKLFELAETDALYDIDGVGPKAVGFLRYLKAFVEYYQSAILNEHAVSVRRDNLDEVLKSIHFPKDSEDLYVICLNRQLRIKYITSVAEDSGEGYVTTRLNRITKAAVASGADDVILVHNHPSGCTEPSQDDYFLTYKIEKMLSAVGIMLVDHFIVCGDEIVSIKMLMKEMEKLYGADA
jgi:DNA repair protein RadC